MTLYQELTQKQKRSIRNDIDLISSLKGVSFPKTFDEIKEIGFLSPTIEVGKSNAYLTEGGKVALRRICDITHQTKKYNDMLNYDDIFQEVISEFGRWLSDGLIPDDAEFINPLDTLLSRKIDNYTFICRVDGLSLIEIGSIVIGNKEIKEYNHKYVSGISGVSDIASDAIKGEYSNSLVIVGSERGSSSVAQEKFYHNAELSLSVLRLYSCAIYTSAIHRVNIRMINNCANAYGPASSVGWKGSEKTFYYLRHYKSTQDLKLDSELLNRLSSECFFEKLAHLIDKQERNELEEAIVKSLFWIGEAQKDLSHASAWIMLWSCVECFFTIGTKEITEQNARGIASILVFGGYSHERYGDYEQLKMKIKNYYRLRSRVVHRAEYIHIDNILLEEFSFIVAWVIITMVSLSDRGYATLAQVQEQSDRLDRKEMAFINKSSLCEKLFSWFKRKKI
jgi:hypothetical protein